jgi:hypothetical protein
MGITQGADENRLRINKLRVNGGDWLALDWGAEELTCR